MRFYPTKLVLCLATFGSAAVGSACPWHELIGQSSVGSGFADNGKPRSAVVQQIDRMTGAETSFRPAKDKVTLPTKYGFACGVVTTAQGFSLNCDRQDVHATLSHSCTGPDADQVKVWDGFDRMGVNIVSVFLACVPTDRLDALVPVAH